MGGPLRIAIVAPDDWTVWLFYRHLIAALQRRGAEVVACTAHGPYISRLTDLGIGHVAVPYGRFVEPWMDVRLFRALRAEFSRTKFDIVQNITIKANIFGALAAARSGVGTIVNTVEGSGLLYSDNPSTKVKAIRAIAEVGLRAARDRVTRYWFVNSRDRDVFVARGLADMERTVVAIATGVDTNQFDASKVSESAMRVFREEVGVAEGIPLVTNVAGRLLRTKGIAEFIEAARIVKGTGVSAQFVLVGPEEPSNPDAFPGEIVKRAVEDGLIKWQQFREDVWTAYASSQVAVVPTYYAEGTPKGVMEAMAMGVALVATDIPSIRALVADGKDGVLVAPRSGAAIATAVMRLLGDPAVANEVGRAARKKAVALFDADAAAENAVDKVYGALPVWCRFLENQQLAH